MKRKRWFPFLDSILALYNQSKFLQIRAQYSQDNQTHDLELNTSFVFSGNFPPFRNRAQKERLVSLTFEKQNCTEQSRKAFEQLKRTPLSSLAYFFVEVMSHRQTFEKKWQQYFDEAQTTLYGVVPDARLVDNHAVVLGFHNLLFRVLGLTPDLEEFTKNRLIEKYQECEQREPSPADEFFDALQRLESFELHSSPWWAREESGRLYIHLSSAIEAIGAEFKSFKLSPKDLYAPLQQHPAFVERKNAMRFSKEDKERNLKAWGFDIEKLSHEFQSDEAGGIATEMSFADYLNEKVRFNRTAKRGKTRVTRVTRETPSIVVSEVSATDEVSVSFPSLQPFESMDILGSWHDRVSRRLKKIEANSGFRSRFPEKGLEKYRELLTECVERERLRLDENGRESNQSIITIPMNRVSDHQALCSELDSLLDYYGPFLECLLRVFGVSAYNLDHFDYFRRYHRSQVLVASKTEKSTTAWSAERCTRTNLLNLEVGLVERALESTEQRDCASFNWAAKRCQ